MPSLPGPNAKYYQPLRAAQKKTISFETISHRAKNNLLIGFFMDERAPSNLTPGGIILDGPTPSAPGGQGAGPLISDASTDTFMRDVIEVSANVPVIVDFWAPWCGPCKTLGPLLEKLVKRMGGLVRMVKINVDENQALAQQLQIKSIPTVYAFKGGKPVDAFQGALPESQLQAFIDKLVGDAKSPIDAAMDAANSALSAGDGQTAEDIFMQILGHDETIIAALAGLIRAQVMSANVAGARETVNALDDKTLLDPDVAAAISVLELAEQSIGATGSDDLDALREKVNKNPKDMNAGMDFSLALYGAGDIEGAIEHLLLMIAKDKAWNDAAARKQLIKIFDALGASDPRVVAGRQKLSIILFS